MGYETYDITLILCGIILRFVSEVPLRVSEEIDVFRTDALPDITVPVRNGTIRLPAEQYAGSPVTMCASEGDWLLSAKKTERETTTIVVRYRPDFSASEILVDAEHCGHDIRQVCSILQCFPIRALLAKYDAVLLHSSRIELGGSAVVFSAPSGTGKTTQARLWAKYAGARIVSNDRTIVRRVGGRFVTSGFPVDGSEPVLDPAIIPLGALVLLRQGAENRAEQLPAGQALALLMEQTALNSRDGPGMTQALLFWSEVLAHCPVYRLTCTPDERAVRCLQKALERNGGE